MIPAAFDYVRPATLDEALGLLAKHGEDAKVLAGGHSLIPAMKLRLSQPKVVVDIGRIGDLRLIAERDGKIAIGALTTHYDIESSDLAQALLLAPSRGRRQYWRHPGAQQRDDWRELRPRGSRGRLAGGDAGSGRRV